MLRGHRGKKKSAKAEKERSRKRKNKHKNKHMNVMPGRKVKCFNKEVVINVSDVIHK